MATPIGAVRQLEMLLLDRLAPDSARFVRAAADDVIRDLTANSNHHPENDGAWVEAKRQSPSREPFTDAELHALRVQFDPRHLLSGQSGSSVVIIWTLLDMIEEQRGWKP